MLEISVKSLPEQVLSGGWCSLKFSRYHQRTCELINVAAWLDGIGLGLYADLFAKNAIDDDVLGELTEEQLKELQVPLGHRLKLLKAIAKLYDVPRSAASAAAAHNGREPASEPITWGACVGRQTFKRWRRAGERIRASLLKHPTYRYHRSKDGRPWVYIRKAGSHYRVHTLRVCDSCSGAHRHWRRVRDAG